MAFLHDRDRDYELVAMFCGDCLGVGLSHDFDEDGVYSDTCSVLTLVEDDGDWSVLEDADRYSDCWQADLDEMREFAGQWLARHCYMRDGQWRFNPTD